MLMTVVSNGNDALNLLFEAARHDGRDLDSVRGTDLTSQASDFLTTSPSWPVQVPNIASLPELSPELAEVWNAYRFVRMGWFSAEEAVWFIDM